jgi:16S rRNA (guanine1207-N2)-methyltransferase
VVPEDSLGQTSHSTTFLERGEFGVITPEMEQGALVPPLLVIPVVFQSRARPKSTLWITLSDRRDYSPLQLNLLCYNSIMADVITESINGVQLKFHTKAGVFSSKGLDQGTRILLENLRVPAQGVVADLGSGAGIIGLYCAIQNPKLHIYLLDANIRAVYVAKSNVVLNQLDNVEAHLSDLYSAVLDRVFDVIITNPPQQLGNQFLLELLEQSFEHLKSTGSLWLVVKSNVKPIIERMLHSLNVNFEKVAQQKGYAVLRASHR